MSKEIIASASPNVENCQWLLTMLRDWQKDGEGASQKAFKANSLLAELKKELNDEEREAVEGLEREIAQS